ncbi:MAG: fibrobacter succinogenes major paralogous domain-containing protein [Bacteroidales bacterium]|jgi:uncharacterized protein (TIGR02145 family)|nr:fibrobacter succinogenes major paralogous domain-containing protein [Bacteroidales bacterium]
MKNTLKYFFLVLAIILVVMGCKKELNPNKNKFTDEQIEALYKEIEPFADAILLSANPDWSNLAAQYKNRKEIKKIDLQSRGFFIEFANGKKRGWILPQPLLSDNKAAKIDFSIEQVLSKLSKPQNVIKPKIVLINTQFYEKGREYNIDSSRVMRDLFINSGWDVDLKDGEYANLRFFAENLCNYDVIYVNGHGYSALDHNWLQVSNNEIGKNSYTSDPNIMFTRSNFSNDSNGIKDYTYVNEEYFNEHYSNESFPNSIIYLTNCQSLKAPNKLAPIFINKGVKVIVGWDESNWCWYDCGGQYVGRLLLRNMLISGETLNTEFNNIDDNLKNENHGNYIARLLYYGRDENGNSGLWKGGAFKLPTEAVEPFLKITFPSYGAIYHCGEWVDIFVSGYTGSDWRENLEVQVSCLVGDPQHTIAPEPCIHLCNQPAYDRAEDLYSFTFSPESPEKWDGRWARLIAHDKKNNIWSTPQYIKVEPLENEKGVVINGIRWATRNVDMPGTFAALPEDAGMFYQWNRKIGWSSTDPIVNSNGGNVWDDSMPSGNIWAKVNDPCPTGWRVPTKEELQSLVNSGSQWTTINGVNGVIFGSDNNIFIPTTGVRRYNGDLINQNTGNYWSASSYPYILSFFNGPYGSSIGVYESSRVNGCCVRCVAE